MKTVADSKFFVYLRKISDIKVITWFEFSLCYCNKFIHFRITIINIKKSNNNPLWSVWRKDLWKNMIRCSLKTCINTDNVLNFIVFFVLTKWINNINKWKIPLKKIFKRKCKKKMVYCCTLLSIMHS